MAPKLKTCAKGIVENIVGEPRLGTPTAWPSKECMRPRGAAARAGGGGTAAGAVNMAPKLKTCAKGIVDSIVGNRVRERQPGTAWPNAGARPGMSSGTSSGHIVGSNVSGTAHSGIFERQPGTPPDRAPRPNTVGNVAGNTCRCIVATGAAALGVRPGTAVLCRTAMAVLLARLFDYFTLRTLESYFSRYWSGQLQATPIKMLAALAFKAAVPKILAKFRLRVLPRLREPSTHLTGPGRVWSSLVAGQRVAS